MAMSYSKLWKLLIDKRMNKTDLRLNAGISTAVIAKMSKGRNLTTDVLLKVCSALDCDISDICEVEHPTNRKQEKVVTKHENS